MRKSKKKKALSAEERRFHRAKREHQGFARQLFRLTGFTRIAAAADGEFTFDGHTSDFDDIFIQNNVIVLIEYTISSASNVSVHLKNKSLIYNKIASNSTAFVAFLRTRFPSLDESCDSIYKDHHIQLFILYASRNTISSELKSKIRGVKYLDYPYLRYFANLANTIKLSARFELFAFLGLKPGLFAEAVLSASAGDSHVYQGSVLPESQSHFPAGFKVLSFYVDAEALLSRAYVLRRDGWRTYSDVYQRMIIKSKIESIRRHLIGGRGVFVNNIIVMLPPTTKIINREGNNVESSDIISTAPADIRLPSEYNSIGLIDGQHRVFSYYEGGMNEDKMRILRKNQNLLVTGIVFPRSMQQIERTRFEARLFLEINSNQSKAKTDLKQEIAVILDPFSPESICKRVINKLNDESGPLQDMFERYFFDKGKLKTTTIVSYGLRRLCGVRSPGSLFEVWVDPSKSDLEQGKGEAGLERYIEFCAASINLFLKAVKAKLQPSQWTPDKAEAGHLLTTTVVNGLILCLRHLTAHGKVYNFNTYAKKLVGVENFDFFRFKSSQYSGLGDALYLEFFSAPVSRSRRQKP